MIKIKRLSPNRWKEYRGLRLEALKKDFIAFGSSYEEEKKLSQSEWKKRIKNTLFALSDNQPIGMIVYIFLKQQKIKHVANIYGVYIKNEFRTQGIGKMLIEAAISEIQKNKSIVKINLNVNPKQKVAVRLYKRYGFKAIGTLKKDLFINGKFYDEVVMEKHL